MAATAIRISLFFRYLCLRNGEIFRKIARIANKKRKPETGSSHICGSTYWAKITAAAKEKEMVAKLRTAARLPRFDMEVL